MSKKKEKPRLPKVNQQIPLARVRPIKFTGPRYHLERAQEYPIIGCWIMADWKESGITPVIIAREQAPDKVLFANYLVDLYCLGIKDVFTKTDISRKAFERSLSAMCNDVPKECTIEFAHELVYGALEFAEKYGFKPPPDFTKELADHVLDAPDAHPRKGNINFGKKGKPIFVAGPYDDERKINQVINTLMRTAGEGNFDYVIGMGDADFFGEE
ncbi:MAG: hypothetical protein FD146_617 [Anaerolineaceae bacterium]|nr:MAG: hypothetical protein FD146_617 [Anaerolineaceae bacterium]